jgi:hypothetical protein
MDSRPLRAGTQRVRHDVEHARDSSLARTAQPQRRRSKTPSRPIEPVGPTSHARSGPGLAEHGENAPNMAPAASASPAGRATPVGSATAAG